MVRTPVYWVVSVVVSSSFGLTCMVHSGTKHVKAFLRSSVGSEWCLTVLTW